MSPSMRANRQHTEEQDVLDLLHAVWRCQQTPEMRAGLPWLSEQQVASLKLDEQRLAALIAQCLVVPVAQGYTLVPAEPVVVECGLEASSAESSRAESQPRPCWQETTRRLLLGEVVVKVVLSTATLEELLLRALHDLGWPERLGNPLQGKRRERNRRLREGARSLSSCQRPHLLDFFVERAEWLRWRPVE